MSTIQPDCQFSSKELELIAAVLNYGFNRRDELLRQLSKGMHRNAIQTMSGMDWYLLRTKIAAASDTAAKCQEPMVLVPLKEAWLFQNPEALASVQEGLKAAAEGKFGTTPNFEADAAD